MSFVTGAHTALGRGEVAAGGRPANPFYHPESSGEESESGNDSQALGWDGQEELRDSPVQRLAGGMNGSGGRGVRGASPKPPRKSDVIEAAPVRSVAPVNRSGGVFLPQRLTSHLPTIPHAPGAPGGEASVSTPAPGSAGSRPPSNESQGLIMHALVILGLFMGYLWAILGLF